MVNNNKNNNVKKIINPPTKVGFFISKCFPIFVKMSKLFHSFFDSYRVKDNVPTIVHIGRNAIGSIELYPSETNPFMEEYGYVRVYDNGELFVDEHLAKLLTYTDLHSEFMEFCFDLWKNKTNQKIYPNCVILSGGMQTMDERIRYRDFLPVNYLVE